MVLSILPTGVWRKEQDVWGGDSFLFNFVSIGSWMWLDTSIYFSSCIGFRRFWQSRGSFRNTVASFFVLFPAQSHNAGISRHKAAAQPTKSSLFLLNRRVLCLRWLPPIHVGLHVFSAKRVFSLLLSTVIISLLPFTY